MGYIKGPNLHYCLIEVDVSILGILENMVQVVANLKLGFGLFVHGHVLRVGLG